MKRKFDYQLLMEFKEILKTTNLERSYQEFVSLFSFLRVELEKLMPEYNFQGSIVENKMDYSYFQFTKDSLKKKGLKIVVVFVHRNFCFEIWLSGLNRKFQCKYYDILKNIQIPFELTDDPNRKDYILKFPLKKDLDISNGEKLVDEIKNAALKLLNYAESLEIKKI